MSSSGGERIQTRRSARHQSNEEAASQSPSKARANEADGEDLLPAGSPQRGGRASRDSAAHDGGNSTVTTLKAAGSFAAAASPPFDEDAIVREMEAKSVGAPVSRQFQRLVGIPLVYYHIREYVARKRGSLDSLLHMVREHEPAFNITRRSLEHHIERNMEYYGVVDPEELATRMRREKQNAPMSINVVKPETIGAGKTAEDEEVESRIMHILETSELASANESHADGEEDFLFYSPDGGDAANEDLGAGAMIMTDEDLEYYQSLPEEARQRLDDFNFRRIASFEGFCVAFRKALAEGAPEVEEEEEEKEPNLVTLLQILQYRRFENPPPLPQNPRELADEEIPDFLSSVLGEEFCYYIDLYTHHHIYGLQTVGLLIEAKCGQPLTEDSVRRLIAARRKVQPPRAINNYDVNVTTGYLSHDYWPSLLCVPEGEHHVRFYNLTNTRADGHMRYYRCSKCCTIRVSANRDIKNPRYRQITPDFQVPKLQIRGEQCLTNYAELEHYPECHPTPIPLMLAEQLDRRARRQASLGLLAPREAWTEAYFEALRISDVVKQYHPDFPSVAELFPSYDACRGQYSRSFHKYKRVLSMPPEHQRQVMKRKLIPSTNSLYHGDDEDSMQQESGSSQFGATSSKRNRGGVRRGREADALFDAHIPPGYKREMAHGYIAGEEGNQIEYYYVDEDEAALRHHQQHEREEYYEEEVDVDQIEQEEVVVTATDEAVVSSRQSPKKDANSGTQENVMVV